MDLFWKTTAAVLIAAILSQMISQREKDLSIVLCLMVCCMAAGIALEFLAPVFDFFSELEALGTLQDNALGILLKILAIGMISQIAATICSESGSSVLGKSLHILGTAVILYLSLPLFSALLDLLQDILGEL